ncbi:MAG: metal ABC transporter ATP-binding protein [Candidatus Nealsonbacteria bacterium]|nr:metal ABC transporter ATP-binding protein [Candidatus Nealsonbacteria bacterium]
MEKGIVLKVENLNVKLEKEVILENLSFEVAEGEVLTILGPNGAGKTALLKTLLGLFPFEGKIEWMAGVKTSYVPQRLPFIKDIPMSVEEFFKLKNISESKAKNILNSIGLKEDILEKRVGYLSSGQFQRILIGWALVSNPQVLLFDEPTTGIDIGGQESVYNLLEKLQKERNLTILLVTHDLSIVYKLATRCLCLNKKMLCYSIPKELSSQQLSQLYGEEVKFYQHNHHE